MTTDYADGHQHEHRHEHRHLHERRPPDTSSATSGDDDYQAIEDRFKFLLLSHKDTDLLTLSCARTMLPLGFPPIDAANLCNLKSDDDIIQLLDHNVHTAARVVIVVRLLGRGVPGFQRLLDFVAKHHQELIVVSGVPGSFEPDLTAMCTNVSSETIHQVMAYFNADGCAHNMSNMFRFLADHLLKFGYGYNAPFAQPDHGLYHPRYVNEDNRAEATALHLHRCHDEAKTKQCKPTVAVLFYRCHFLSGNTAFVDALLDELEALGVNGIGLFTESLRDHQSRDNVNGQQAVERFPTALTYLLHETTGECMVDVLISTMAFAMGEVNPDGPTLGSWSTEGLQILNVPVVQAINSVETRQSWEASARGLNPLDTAMNVAIPEFDGRIISVPITFMAPQDETGNAQYYEPLLDRVEQVAKQAARLGWLRYKPNQDKRIAFMLTNSSGKAQRIGDAVGLDTPASVMHLFDAMRAADYDLGDDLPADGDTLIQNLVDRCSYDKTYLTEHQLANAAGHVPKAVYKQMYERLPSKQRQQMENQWGPAPGEAYVHEDAIALSGLEFGNVFVALQPPRGYGMDPDAIYHKPDLPPPHNYYALYRWLRNEWKADAIVHMGKHGTLEWLPGKGVGLSSDCYPDSFLDDMPLIYPFILNDPGEGTQSKRRAHATIIDHMCPPMTTADGYGELAQLMQLVDEYYQVEMLDPSKLPLIQSQIWELIQKVNLGEDLALLLNHDHEHDHDHHDKEEVNNEGHDHSHLHHFQEGETHDEVHHHSRWHPTKEEETHSEGRSHSHAHHTNTVEETMHPEGHGHSHSSDEDETGHSHEHHEHSNSHTSKVTLNEDGTPNALAKMDGKDFAHLMEDMDGYLCELAGAQIRDGLHVLGQVPQGDQMIDTLHSLTRLSNLNIPSLREATATMFGLNYIELLSNQGSRLKDVPLVLARVADRHLATTGDAVETIDEFAKHLLALLAQQNFCVESIPKAIDRTFPGLAESAEVSDIKTTLTFVCETLVPSLRKTTQEISYLLGSLGGGFVPGGPSGSPTRGMAHTLPTGRNFYSVDPNALPSMAAWEVGKRLATEVLSRYLKESAAYPEHVAISVWGTAAMRTHGDDIAEIFALLGVTPTWQQENHRVTGVKLIPLSELGRPRIDVTVRISGFFRDAFPHLITLMDEAVNLAINADEPLNQNFIRKHYLEDIADEDMDEASARYRVYGCPPGAYGIGILDLIEAQNWTDESDFAKCYINWGGYAYSANEPHGVDARTQFTHRLTSVEVAIHNQDDREHDILDSDDYFQFHGGMIATIKALSGKQPKGYFSDTQNPATPKVRDIREETLRVYRTRVVNPKWLESIMQHGYKGASEMAATVEYLFGFDATANVVSDFMYEQVAQSYALDKATQDFYERCNPWALTGVSERLLEAAQRGMWENPDPETLEALRQTLLQNDARLEGRSEPPK